MAWNLEGTYFETCPCNVPCPCVASMSLGADLDFCGLLMVFNIESGNVEGVDVGGVHAAMLVNSPKVMTDGGWKVGLWIDGSATDEQAEALGRVFSGQLGGPPAALAPLLGEFLGVERASLKIEENGLTHSLKIGGEVDIEVEDIVPFGVETGETAKYKDVFHPAGSTLTLSRATGTVNAFGLEYEARTGVSNPDFSWSG